VVLIAGAQTETERQRERERVFEEEQGRKDFAVVNAILLHTFVRRQTATTTTTTRQQ